MMLNKIPLFDSVPCSMFYDARLNQHPTKLIYAVLAPVNLNSTCGDAMYAYRYE